jgi:hypothetical protein
MQQNQNEMYFPSEMLLHPQHPCRPVDARWQRVTDLTGRGEPANHKWDDDWVRRGLDYLNRLRACRDDADRDRLARAVPDIDAAYRLHETPDKLTRGILEARILARQGAEEVAADRGLTPAAVTAYEALFFSVRGKLDAQLYILGHAIGPRLWYGATEDDVDVLLKWAGYIRGPALLDVMVRYFTSAWKVPEHLTGLSGGELQELYLMLGVRTLLLIQATTTTALDVLRMFRFVELFEEFEGFIKSLPVEPASGSLTAREGNQGSQSGLALSPGGTAALTGHQVSAPGADPEAWWSAWRAEVLAA